MKCKFLRQSGYDIKVNEGNLQTFPKWAGATIENNDENVLIFFNNLMELSNSNLLKELKIKFDIGSLKRLILFSEDMDFIQNQSTIDTIVKNLNDIFQNHIDKIKITLLSKSWNLNWGNIFTSNNLGCLSMVIDRNIQLGKNYNLLNLSREKHFITTQNAPRASRMYLYDFLIKNNLLDKFEYSFFVTQNKEYLMWQDVIGGTDNLQPLTGKYLKKNFDNENIVNPLEDLQLVNFTKELNTYFSVLMETSYCTSENYYGISEKSFKGFSIKKPFLLFASAGAYKGLTELGFKMYDNIFDLSYMHKTSHYERLEGFTNEIKRICELPINEIQKLYIDNLETIEYNYNNLTNLIEKEKSDFLNLFW